METMSVSAVPFLPHTPFLSPDVDPDTAEPDITPYNSLLVEWTRRKVMHHVPMELTPLVLEFPRVDGEQEYEMKYQIVADNVPAPVEGLIRISVIGEEQSYDISRRIH